MFYFRFSKYGSDQHTEPITDADTEYGWCCRLVMTHIDVHMPCTSPLQLVSKEKCHSKLLLFNIIHYYILPHSWPIVVGQIEFVDPIHDLFPFGTGSVLVKAYTHWPLVTLMPSLRFRAWITYLLRRTCTVGLVEYRGVERRHNHVAAALPDHGDRGGQGSGQRGQGVDRE